VAGIDGSLSTASKPQRFDFRTRGLGKTTLMKEIANAIAAGENLLGTVTTYLNGSRECKI